MRFRGFLCVLGVAVQSVFAAQDVRKAEELFQRTDFEASAALLDKNSNDGATLFLLGRDSFMLSDFKKSTDYLQRATAADARNSDYFDWLGRAYGKRAETSNPLFAPGFAAKARHAFEQSVELNPTNRDALDDVFDFYLEAPGFLGGGFDKAAAVAERIETLDPAEGYHDKAKLDQKRKEFGPAELYLRKAVAASPSKVGHLIALAKFLAFQGRPTESEAVFAQAQKVAPNNPNVLFAHADTLIKQRRNLEEAKALLNDYMRASLTPDDPPKEEALRLLKQAGGA